MLSVILFLIDKANIILTHTFKEKLKVEVNFLITISHYCVLLILDIKF